MAVAEHGGQTVEYEPLPHDVGGGVSYQLRLGPSVVVHVAMPLGQSLTAEGIVAKANYWRLVMERQSR